MVTIRQTMEKHNENRREIQTKQHSKLINLLEAEHILQIRESSGHEEQHSRSFYETHWRIAYKSSCEEIGLRFQDMADGGTNEDRWWQLTAFNKRLQLSRGVSSFSFNMWHLYTNTVSSLLLSSLLSVFFFLSLSTDRYSSVVQYSSWLVHARGSNRPWAQFVFCLCKTRTVHTVILIPYIVYHYFRKDRNCEICKRTKITRAPRRKRTGDAVLGADFFGDLIIPDHKVLKEGCETRYNQRYAVAV